MQAKTVTTTWSLLGSGTTASFQVTNLDANGYVLIAATATNTAPANDLGWRYREGQGELERPTAVLGGSYLWARTKTGVAQVMVHIE